ncbi:class I SAM-dependent methyltransferase [Chromohalobacter israelensis]|uniref:class I SAM-dependent methyltransferase n=1 Tax=Chromohalobacter israelensis TaxID=141390 RepID=UPI000D71C713|nr:class I SAM-dependent methyltransferase [Chromohalobacter salexigens]PWW36481.1 methyltransferase family protein [Chromohalobacter salexigens]
MEGEWDAYYSRLATFNDPYRQVGKTKYGAPVGVEQLGKISTHIARALSLTVEDSVLDLGCGNGLLTRNIAEKVYEIIGVEKNKDLYDEAVRQTSVDNIFYINCDILEFIEAGKGIKKGYLYEVLQHIPYKELPRLIKNQKSILGKGGKLFIGGIPDEERKWRFYYTKSQREFYYNCLMEGREALGYWYKSDFLMYVCGQLNVGCRILRQPKKLYTSHYRFDCILTF